MQVLLRARPERIRRSAAFMVSCGVHGFLLAWLLVSVALEQADERRSIYEQEIRPNEHRILYYDLRTRVPEIAPDRAARKVQTLRAQKKLDQSLVAGAKDDPHPQPKVWTPAPPKDAPAEPLPNLLAMTRPVRQFVPPEERPRTPETAPRLPDAPKLEEARPVEAPKLAEAPMAKAVRRFASPEVRRRAMEAAPELPDAPKLEEVRAAAANPIEAPMTKAVRRFAAPEAQARTVEAAAPLPEAPRVEAMKPVALPELLGTANPKAVRRYAAPAAPPHTVAAAAPLPEAPKVSQGTSGARLPFDMPAAPAATRRYSPPPASKNAVHTGAPALPSAPELRVAPGTDAAAASLAIVGLEPRKVAPPVKPPPPRDAGFSGGPKVQPGESSAASNASVVVPGLLAQGSNKDPRPLLMADLSPSSRENLSAALHESLKAAPPPAPVAHATPVSGAPDSRLNGRAIYMMSIHMPNITSFSGNWIIWFAGRDGQNARPAAAMSAPVPVRKVDPKYVADAAREGVEGVVRLSAVIRKDGRVDSVEILKHLDDRLDLTAQEALAKWEFEPARREGQPVDVDAVFEIPFRLAPKTAK